MNPVYKPFTRWLATGKEELEIKTCLKAMQAGNITTLQWTENDF